MSTAGQQKILPMTVVSHPPLPPTDLTYMRVPGALRGVVTEIVAHTDRWCADLLDAEYRTLCQRLAAMLARKRPSSPLSAPADGDALVWAAGVLWTVGTNNFLFDPDERPHATRDDLALLTGVEWPAMGACSAEIAQFLKLDPYQVDLCRRSVLARHPYAWFVRVDGALVDVRTLPFEIQREARRLGLVPHLGRLA